MNKHVLGCWLESDRSERPVAMLIEVDGGVATVLAQEWLDRDFAEVVRGRLRMVGFLNHVVPDSLASGLQSGGALAGYLARLAVDASGNLRVVEEPTGGAA